MLRWKLQKRLRKMPRLSEISSRKEKKEIRREEKIHALKTETRTETRSLLTEIRIKRVTSKTTEIKGVKTERAETETLPARTIRALAAQTTETKISPKITVITEASETTNSRDLRKMIRQPVFLYLTA